MSNGSREPKRLKSVQRALAVLSALAEAPHALGVSELARRTAIPKSSVYLCLQTLRDAGFVDQEYEGDRYRLGLQAAQIGVTAMERSSLGSFLTPAMRRLADRSGEAVSLGILADRSVLFVERFETAHVLRTSIKIGSRMPLHASASGKCLLAGMSRDEIDALYPHGDLPQQTSRTIHDKATLLAELDVVRRQGYALNEDEFVDGVSGAAVPIRRNGRTVAALSIAGPTPRFRPAEWVDELLAITRAAKAGDPSLRPPSRDGPSDRALHDVV